MLFSIRVLLCVGLFFGMVLDVSGQNVPAKPASNRVGNPPEIGSSAVQPGQTEHLQLQHLLESLTPYYPSKNELKGKVVLSGTSMLTELGHQWAVNFKKFHPMVEFSGGADGSEEALKALANDPTIVAGVSRAVNEKDQALLQAGKCKQPIAIVAATSAMAVLVHKDNPIIGLQPEQVQAIFAAGPDGNPKLKTWGELGVKDKFANQPIHLYQREDGSGTQSYIRGTILGGAAIAKGKGVFTSNGEVAKAIAGDPVGIGLGELSNHDPNIRRVPLLLQGQSVPAEETSVLAGKYPLMRPLILIVDQSQLATDGGIRESIMRYVLSKDGQTEVLKAGYYPLDPSFIRQQLDAITGKQIR